MSWGWRELYGMFQPPGSVVSAGDGPVTPPWLTERNSGGSPPCGRTTTSRRSAGTRQEWSLTRDSVATSQSSTWTASGHRAGPGERVPPLPPVHRGPVHGAATAAATTGPRSTVASPSGFFRADAPVPGSRAPTGPSSGSSRRADCAPAGVVYTQATHRPARDPAAVPALIPPVAHHREGPGPFDSSTEPPRRRSPDAERRARPRAPEAPVSQALWRHDEKQRRRMQGLSEGPPHRHELGSVAHRAAEHHPWRPESSLEGGPRRRPEEVRRENGGDLVATPPRQVAARTSASEGGKPKKRVHWRRRQANG